MSQSNIFTRAQQRQLTIDEELMRLSDVLESNAQRLNQPEYISKLTARKSVEISLEDDLHVTVFPDRIKTGYLFFIRYNTGIVIEKDGVHKEQEIVESIIGDKFTIWV